MQLTNASLPLVSNLHSDQGFAGSLYNRLHIFLVVELVHYVFVHHVLNIRFLLWNAI